MPRPPRLFSPGTPVHIIHRGNNRGAVFFAKDDRAALMKMLCEAAAEHGVAVHAYVLMDNHIHLLATPERANSVPAAMKQVGMRYGRFVNATHRRTGTLWEGRYRACPIDSEAYLLTCMRYIELNPVRAGIVAAPEDFRWSSYRANALGVDDMAITTHPLLRDLGATWSERRAAYRALFHAVIPEESLEALRTATHFGWPLGSDSFARSLAKILGVRTAPKHRRSHTAYARFVSDTK